MSSRKRTKTAFARGLALLLATMTPLYGCASSTSQEEVADVQESPSVAESMSIKATDSNGDQIRLDIGLDADSKISIGGVSVTHADGTIDSAITKIALPSLKDLKFTVDADGTQHVAVPDYGSITVRDLSYGTDGKSFSAMLEGPQGRQLPIQLDNIPEAQRPVAGALATPAVGLICVGPQVTICLAVVAGVLLLCGALVVTTIIACYNAGGSFSWSLWPPCTGACTMPPKPTATETPTETPTETASATPADTDTTGGTTADGNGGSSGDTFSAL